MKIIIKLQDKREIETEINPAEYEELKKELVAGRIKFLNFENRFIKTSLINSIEPVEETVPKEFRLPEPKFERIGTSKSMEELFNLLKLKGLFKECRNYQEWCKAKYG